MITLQSLESLLKQYVDPYLKQDLITAKAVRAMEVKDDRVQITIALKFPAEKSKQALKAFLLQHLPTLENKLDLHFSWRVISHTTQPGVSPLKGVKNVVAVASGKGGVGKSTTAVNLALALQAEGARVGILDADIYGPSQPMMLGEAAHPVVTEEKKFEPVVRHGLQSMSIGYLIEMDTPMIWRGPMVSKALQQLIYDTLWNDLDYLVVDLPPGTGDVQLTLAQKIPVSAAVIVTTPQDLALLDAQKALAMFQKVQIPVLGIVENMSVYTCPHCQQTSRLFGEGGGYKMATQSHIELLAQMPLDPAIQRTTDSGAPIVVSDPDGVIALQYRAWGLRLAAKLSLQAQNYQAKFPKIVTA